MLHHNVKLQIAAVVCVQNLTRASDDDGAMASGVAGSVTERQARDRQQRLKEMGVHKILQQLLTTKDSVLFEK